MLLRIRLLFQRKTRWMNIGVSRFNFLFNRIILWINTSKSIVTLSKESVISTRFKASPTKSLHLSISKPKRLSQQHRITLISTGCLLQFGLSRIMSLTLNTFQHETSTNSLIGLIMNFKWRTIVTKLFGLIPSITFGHLSSIKFLISIFSFYFVNLLFLFF